MAQSAVNATGIAEFATSCTTRLLRPLRRRSACQADSRGFRERGGRLVAAIRLRVRRARNDRIDRLPQDLQEVIWCRARSGAGDLPRLRRRVGASAGERIGRRADRAGRGPSPRRWRPRSGSAGHDSGDQHAKHHAEREDVASRVTGADTELPLLGRHELGRAKPVRHMDGSQARVVREQRARDAEVDDRRCEPALAVGGEQDVAR